MKGKKPPKKAGPSEVSREAGCSKSQAHKLLRRGLTKPEIVARTQERKARAASRAGYLNGHGDGHGDGNGDGVIDLPVIPVAESEPVPPFAVSEAVKEHHLAQIRRMQAEKMRGTVLAVEPLRSVIFTASTYLTRRLRDLPDEMADDLGVDLTKRLRDRIHGMLDEAHRVMVWEGARHGIAPPKEPTPAVRSRLAYYERFIRDSRTGETEVIPANERIDSEEWRRLHPSVTFEQGFEILAAKRRWDERMSQLLSERSSWDLPSELAPEPPPPEPEAA